MSIVHWIWLVSVLAATALVAGGYLLGARKNVGAQAAQRMENHRAHSQVSQARIEITRARHEREESMARYRALYEQYQLCDAERQGALSDRDAILAQREVALRERDAAYTEYQSLAAHRDAAVAEANALRQKLQTAIDRVGRLSHGVQIQEDAANQRVAQLEEERGIQLQRIDKLDKQKAQLSAAVQQADATARELATRLKAAESARRSQVADLEKRGNDLQARLQVAERSRKSRIAELEAKLTDHVGRLGVATAKVKELSEKAGLADAKQRELEAARRELESMQRALDETKGVLEQTQRAVADLPELEKIVAERDEFLLEIDVLRRRLEKVDALEERLAESGALAEVNAHLAAQLEELTDEVEQLRALALVKGEASNANGSELRASNGADGKPTLEGAIADVSSGGGHRSTVVADDLGFPVVGHGDHQEPLAALCGVLGDVRQRAKGLLPIGRVRRITLETEHGVTVSACSQDEADLNLTLATVTAGPAKETPALLQALVNVTYALRRGHRAENRREP